MRTTSHATLSTDVPRFVQLIAILCRTLVVILVAWIVLPLTWPTGVWNTRFADLTVGGVISALFWFGVSLAAGTMLLAFGMNIPAREKRSWWWYHRWIDVGLFIVVAYGIAFIVLMMKPTQDTFHSFVQMMAGLMWSIVLP
jgi:hypothetical protein